MSKHSKMNSSLKCTLYGNLVEFFLKKISAIFPVQHKKTALPVRGRQYNKAIKIIL